MGKCRIRSVASASRTLSGALPRTADGDANQQRGGRVCIRMRDLVAGMCVAAVLSGGNCVPAGIMQTLEPSQGPNQRGTTVSVALTLKSTPPGSSHT